MNKGKIGIQLNTLRNEIAALIVLFALWVIICMRMCWDLRNFRPGQYDVVGYAV